MALRGIISLSRLATGIHPPLLPPFPPCSNHPRMFSSPTGDPRRCRSGLDHGPQHIRGCERRGRPGEVVRGSLAYPGLTAVRSLFCFAGGGVLDRRKHPGRSDTHTRRHSYHSVRKYNQANDYQYPNVPFLTFANRTVYTFAQLFAIFQTEWYSTVFFFTFVSSLFLFETGTDPNGPAATCLNTSARRRTTWASSSLSPFRPSVLLLWL